MLHNIDRVFAWLVWLAAAAVVVMLLAGPQVVAEDKAKQQASYAAPSGAPDGKAIFTQNCGTCHTLKAAGTAGQIGPALDNVSLDATQIQQIVTGGRGGMPSFNGRLSSAEISAVAKFVAASS